VPTSRPTPREHRGTDTGDDARPDDDAGDDHGGAPMWTVSCAGCNRSSMVTSRST
jgi:hypothetical protein